MPDTITTHQRLFRLAALVADVRDQMRYGDMPLVRGSKLIATYERRLLTIIKANLKEHNNEA